MVQEPNNSCFMPKEGESGCCKVEAIVNIDERGQMVLPKEVRDKAKIKPEDKLVLLALKEEGRYAVSV